MKKSKTSRRAGRARRVQPYGTSTKEAKRIALLDITKDGRNYIAREYEVMELMKFKFPIINIDKVVKNERRKVC